MPARHAPATERNRGPILDVLRRVLPPEPRVLEIASGTGQHAAWFAEHLPSLWWQPTDADADALDSIAAWRLPVQHAVAPPQHLDVTRSPWPPFECNAMFCSNLIHIAPEQAAHGLFDGAQQLLPAGAPLILYGPFRRGGVHTSPSNVAFDASLRERDPRWGVRDLEWVVAQAADRDLSLDRIVAMPANNLSVVLRRG